MTAYTVTARRAEYLKLCIEALGYAGSREWPPDPTARVMREKVASAYLEDAVSEKSLETSPWTPRSVRDQRATTVRYEAAQKRMARANLPLGQDLLAAFQQAQDGSVRSIQVQILEEALVLAGTCLRAGTEEIDFGQSILPLLNHTEPLLILFALDGTCNQHVQWALLSYIPETAPVRDKMLYSSSREDLKRGLGLSMFAADLNGDSRDEMTYEALRAAMSKSDSDAPLTELEKLKLDERAMEKDTSVRASAMNVVPFGLGDALRQVLVGLGEPGELSTNNCWSLIVDPDNETINVESVKLLIDIGAELTSMLPEAEPRYFILKTGGGPIFLYWCPDEAPVRAKMTYSTAKATVLGETSRGVFRQVLEIRQAVDVSDAVRTDTTTQTASCTEQNTAGKLSHNLAHSRPARPGKGKARIVQTQLQP